MNLPIAQAGGPGFDLDRYWYELATDPPGVIAHRHGLASLFGRGWLRPLTDRRAAVQCRSHVVITDDALGVSFTPVDAAAMVVEAATMLRRYPEDTLSVMWREHAEALVLLDVTLNELSSGSDEDVRAQMWTVRGAVKVIQEALGHVRSAVGLGEDTGYDNGLKVIALEPEGQVAERPAQ